MVGEREKTNVSTPGRGIGKHSEAKPLQSPSSGVETEIHGLPKAEARPKQQRIPLSQASKYGIKTKSSLLLGKGLEAGKRPTILC